MAGSVEDREMLLFGLEKRATALHLSEGNSIISRRFACNGGHKKKTTYKRMNLSWFHMHSTSKQIVLESPGCSGFEALSIVIK